MCEDIRKIAARVRAVQSLKSHEFGNVYCPNGEEATPEGIDSMYYSDLLDIADAYLAENPPPGETQVQKAVRLMVQMSDSERVDVMAYFCKYCGEVNPRCQCWNDE